MKALVMEAYRTFVYKDVPTPKPASGEVLVRVKACAVCGSDVHGIDGSTHRRQPPVIMGHEAAGVIEAVGDGVSGYKPGDRVTFDSTIYCGTCDRCRAGLVNLCASRRVLGVSCDDYRQDGAFAEFVLVPQHILYPLPDKVSFTQAAMVEPLAIAMHAATRTKVQQGAAVLIAGVGTIGMLTLQVVGSMGAATLIAVDVDNKKLAAARANGATHCFNTSEPDVFRKILHATGGEGVDIAFDAVGIAETVNLCIDAARLNGAIVLVGNLKPSIDFPLQKVVTRQLSLFGSCASAGEYGACLDLIAKGVVDTDRMISRTVPLSEGGAWINRVYEREKGLNKIVLIP